MRITHLHIKNFRLLKDVNLSLEEQSTVIVGRNNSGKTSLTEIFRRLLSDKNPQFNLYDFSISSLIAFKDALKKKIEGGDLSEIREMIPFIEIRMKIAYDIEAPNLGVLSNFIIDLDLNCTEALIIIRYQIEDGKIDNLFEGLDSFDEKTNLQFFKLLKERIPRFFMIQVLAQDPNDHTNSSIVDYIKFKQLIGAGFINAQRGLDDSTHTEKDVLGKFLGKLFKSASDSSAPDDMRNKSEELKQIMSSIQDSVDKDFNKKLDDLLPALKIFGYPGLADPGISTETTIGIENILESNTKIRYHQGDEVFLPETYNGLGSRNLIYMLFQLFEFFREWQTRAINNGLYLIFIEEPEAHLHPQMQQIFVKQINFLVSEFSQRLNLGHLWPVQFVITTHSTHIANEANFESIRYFLTTRNEKTETRIKDLRTEFSTQDVIKDKEFLHKYLTLTRCDLFFSDKAMLIEGATERILMPMIIKKIDEYLPADSKLSPQYISIIEIGGAYAHHFYKFVDFLELQTLIITDIDSVRIKKIKGKDTYRACTVVDGSHSSNSGIRNWFSKDKAGHILLSELASKTFDQKSDGCRRIAYQIPEIGKNYCARSFEDAFILANIDLFNIRSKNNTTIPKRAYQQARKFRKTNFALEYALDKTTWNIPLYIKEGLEWLSKQPNTIVSEIQEVIDLSKD